MNLRTLALASLALLALPTLALASPVTYPGPSATDSGTGAAVTSGVTATVASVTDLDGNAKSASLAAAHVAGGNTSAVYDAAVNGEAWVTLTLTASGHTFAPVVIYCSVDPSTLATTSTITASNNVTLALLKSGQILGAGSVTATTTPSATSFSTTLTASTDVISGDGLVFTSGVDAGKDIHVLSNSAGVFTLPGTGLPAAPAAGDTFVLIPFSKSLTSYLAALGTDSRPLLSASDVQAGAEVQAATTTTIPAAGTTTGVSEVLTAQQSQALLLSLSAGASTNTAPAASSTATVTYYLVGRPKTSASIVAVSSPAFDATRTLSGRTVLIAQPFPTL